MTLSFPRDVRERARAIKERTKISFAQLIRDGVIEKIEAIEAKIREADERAQVEKEQAAAARRQRENNLAPKKISTFFSPPVEREPEIDPLDEVYEDGARHVFEVIDAEPSERRLRVAEVVAAIKKRKPLTHPSDADILRELEKRLVALQEEKQRQPKPKSETPLPEPDQTTTLDLSRVRRQGDVR